MFDARIIFKKEKNVLPSMPVTLDVSHFERSLLNTEASQKTIKERSKEKSCTVIGKQIS